MDEDGDGIYDDLDDFHLKEELERKGVEYSELAEKLNEAQQTIEKLGQENKKIIEQLELVERNYSAVLKTARNEIQRKVNEIAALRKEKDDICFRRAGKNNVSRQNKGVITQLSFKPSENINFERTGDVDNGIETVNCDKRKPYHKSDRKETTYNKNYGDIPGGNSRKHADDVLIKNHLHNSIRPQSNESPNVIENVKAATKPSKDELCFSVSSYCKAYSDDITTNQVKNPTEPSRGRSRDRSSRNHPKDSCNERPTENLSRSRPQEKSNSTNHLRDRSRNKSRKRLRELSRHSRDNQRFSPKVRSRSNSKDRHRQRRNRPKSKSREKIDHDTRKRNAYRDDRFDERSSKRMKHDLSKNEIHKHRNDGSVSKQIDRKHSSHARKTSNDGLSDEMIKKKIEILCKENELTGSDVKWESISGEQQVYNGQGKSHRYDKDKHIKQSTHATIKTSPENIEEQKPMNIGSIAESRTEVENCLNNKRYVSNKPIFDETNPSQVQEKMNALPATTKSSIESESELCEKTEISKSKFIEQMNEPLEDTHTKCPVSNDTITTGSNLNTSNNSSANSSDIDNKPKSFVISRPEPDNQHNFSAVAAVAVAHEPSKLEQNKKTQQYTNSSNEINAEDNNMNLSNIIAMDYDQSSSFHIKANEIVRSIERNALYKEMEKKVIDSGESHQQTIDRQEGKEQTTDVPISVEIQTAKENCMFTGTQSLTEPNNLNGTESLEVEGVNDLSTETKSMPTKTVKNISMSTSDYLIVEDEDEVTIYVTRKKRKKKKDKK